MTPTPFLLRLATLVASLASVLVAAAPAAAATAATAALPDRGVYGWLDPEVTLGPPAGLSPGDLRLRRDRSRKLLTLLRGNDAVKVYPTTSPGCEGATPGCLGLRDGDRAELAKLFPATASWPVADVDAGEAARAFRDTDGDGIADAVDILLGGKKTVLLGTPYVETARKLPYPGGDMPTSEGVCTDVVVRALRNAGIDLQKEVFEDAGRSPRSYPAIAKRNPSIDHRRVRNLMVFFERHFRRLAPGEHLLPGDVVLLDTFPARKGVEHIGLVSDRLGSSGRPLVINAWTDGYRTSEMDLLGFVAAPAVYRVPPVASPSAGAPVPAPGGFRVPPDTRQIVLAVSTSWSARSAELTSWRRTAHGWTRVAGPLPAMLGKAGLGWGRGLLPVSAIANLGGPTKREGDDRAPAGVFHLSGATGYPARPPPRTRLPYTQATPALKCVDDPRSRHYNQVLEQTPAKPPPWSSAESMLRDDAQYALTIAVDHNRHPVEAGAGSCIFLHAWPAPDASSPGCTMLNPTDIARLLAWLDPALAPVLVQLPRPVYRAVAAAWDLPPPADVPPLIIRQGRERRGSEGTAAGRAR